MKSRNKKTKLTLLILIICITLGYAALRTGLNINGTATIPSVSWDVYFANYQNSASTNITPTTEPSTPAGTKPTTVSYAVALTEPGDLYEFTIDVVNGGTIDANINLVSKLDGEEIDSENPIPDYLTYTITDTNDQPIQTDHRLNHGVTETYKIKLLFKTDIDPEDLPSEGDTLYLDIELTATQAEKEPEETGTFVVTRTNISMALPLPEGINLRSTPQLAMDDWQDILQTSGATRPFFLKLIISNEDDYWCITSNSYDSCLDYNTSSYFSRESCLDDLNNKYSGDDLTCTQRNGNILKESYVGFVITDELKTQWKNINCSEYDEESTQKAECIEKYDNLVNGTYYLRGGVDESSLVEKPIYEANKNVMKQAFNYTVQPDVCHTYPNDDEFSCYLGFQAVVSTSSVAYAYGGGTSYCEASSDGSYCHP